MFNTINETGFKLIHINNTYLEMEYDEITDGKPQFNSIPEREIKIFKTVNETGLQFIHINNTYFEMF